MEREIIGTLKGCIVREKIKGLNGEHFFMRGINEIVPRGEMGYPDFNHASRLQNAMQVLKQRYVFQMLKNVLTKDEIDAAVIKWQRQNGYVVHNIYALYRRNVKVYPALTNIVATP